MVLGSETKGGEIFAVFHLVRVSSLRNSTLFLGLQYHHVTFQLLSKNMLLPPSLCVVASAERTIKARRLARLDAAFKTYRTCKHLSPC